MKINAQPEKLQDFAATVSQFRKNVLEECTELYAAMGAMATFLDPETLDETEQMLREICRILEAAEPDLAQLHEKVLSFSRMVDRLQTLLNY